jgi:hypothetical protein
MAGPSALGNRRGALFPSLLLGYRAQSILTGNAEAAALQGDLILLAESL